MIFKRISYFLLVLSVGFTVYNVVRLNDIREFNYFPEASKPKIISQKINSHMETIAGHPINIKEDPKRDRDSELVFKTTEEKNKSYDVSSYSIRIVLGIFLIALSMVGLSSVESKKDCPVFTDLKAKSKRKGKGKEEVEIPNVTFDDVGGIEEVKEEMNEIIDFIKNAEKYNKVGAKIPRGVMLYGPPGTGKTLMAKVLACEGKCSFYSTSGSEFVEKYVGVGAKRIRSLFAEARKNSPSIIFIDEIDAVAGRRGDGNNAEKDQTLNQLLVEMDGVNSSKTIIIVAATNRLDILDQALLRAGRFDRHIYVGNPNIQGREQILKIHTENKPLDQDVIIERIAKRTSGMSGASLASVTNEAALYAVRCGRDKITNEDFDYAIEKVIAGLKKKNAVISDKDKITVAYHEAGHAIVARILNIDQVEKISIVPRGQALGYVIQMPEEDRLLIKKSELLGRIKVALGGRICEETVFGDITTGASNDLQKSTEIALQMVCEYGMGSYSIHKISSQYGNMDPRTLNEEVKKIIEECYGEAKSIVHENMDKIEKIVAVLIDQEEIEYKEIDQIFS